MIELIMYFGIGFLVAALIGLAIIPIVHNRAVGLTVRRIEASTPLATADIYADKDQLRAEFAMSSRRLEMMIEELQAKNTNQLAELGRKTDALNGLKIELSEKIGAMHASEAREKSLRDRLRSIEDTAANRELSDEHAGMGEHRHRVPDLEKQLTAQATKIQILNAENARLQTELAQMRAERDRLARENADLEHDTKERSKIEKIENDFLRERINDVAAQIVRLSSALEGPNSVINPIIADKKHSMISRQSQDRS